MKLSFIVALESGNKGPAGAPRGALTVGYWKTYRTLPAMDRYAIIATTSGLGRSVNYLTLSELEKVSRAK